MYTFHYRKSAPKFLLDVYKQLNNDESNESSGRFTRSAFDEENLITDIDREAIEESDIIMTFLNKSNFPHLIKPSPNPIIN